MSEGDVLEWNESRTAELLEFYADAVDADEDDKFGDAVTLKPDMARWIAGRLRETARLNERVEELEGALDWIYRHNARGDHPLAYCENTLDNIRARARRALDHDRDGAE